MELTGVWYGANVLLTGYQTCRCRQGRGIATPLLCFFFTDSVMCHDSESRLPWPQMLLLAASAVLFLCAQQSLAS